MMMMRSSCCFYAAALVLLVAVVSSPESARSARLLANMNVKVAVGGSESSGSSAASSSSSSSASAAAGTRTIQGRIKLDGTFYHTVCHCGRNATSAGGNCKAPHHIRVHQNPYNKHRGMARQELKEVLGTPDKFDMLDASRTSFADVDCRERHAVLATPGGDFGEFLTALNVYQANADKDFSAERVQHVLESWLESSTTSFYFNTDELAVKNLREHLTVAGRQGVVGLDLTNPKVEYRKSLLRDLCKSDNQGSYFLKAVLDHPDRFYMRGETVCHAVQAFFKILWQRGDEKPKVSSIDGETLYSKLNFQVLQGALNCRAWINFRANHHCEEEHKAPAFTPAVDDSQVFVCHPEAVSILRERLGAHMLREGGLPTSLQLKPLVQRIQRRSFINMEHTAESVGSNVPFYTATIE
eukprot:TRINITY_DN66068_c10_g1_i1.p1 TRINITY_DN66068_c10_g1~~TRINITY_DN66068_c10_g1_i1.p1  ORF type:complete len:428 (+),score=216.71 TRINITY_DN66068_c10_g1_i1:51-1286(+)